MTLERGALLYNRYRILDILGQGGMGSIYRAVDDNLGVEVAVKENLFTTDEYARQFRREATILAGLRHPNLPRVSDHFVVEGQGQYLIMDYIEGEDLRERMDRQGVISEEEALVIGAAICDALTHMHTQNPPILHRDLKPGNVKITPEGKVFLVDFGLAKVAFMGQRTTTGARAMTPGYSPPEQYGGARTDHRSDIYSLAATLYAGLAGVVPEDSLARTMEQADLTPLRNRNTDVSRRFSKIIEKALAVHPDDRFQTADEFKQALIETISASKRPLVEQGVVEPILSTSLEDAFIDESIRRESPRKDSSQPDRLDVDEYGAKRSRSWLTVIGILIVLMIIGVGIVYLVNPALPDRLVGALFAATEPAGGSTQDVPTSTVESAMANLTDTLEPSSTAAPLTATQESVPTSTATIFHTPTVADSPTSTSPPVLTPVGGGYGQVAFASDRTGTPQIWVINSDGTGLRQLTNSQWGACQPDWSPDGERLVFISPCEENQEMYDIASMFIINTDGTGLEALPAEDGGGFDPAWSPDGNFILFTSIRNNFRPQIFMMSVTTKESFQLSEENWRDSQAEWYPDGSKILFVSTRNGPYQIWTMNPDGSEQLRFTASGSLWDTYPVWSPDGSVIIFTQRSQGGIPRLVGATYPDGGTAEFDIYTVFGSVPMREADISPDGHWLAFESWPEDSQHDIWLLRASGSDLTQLTFDEAFDFDPAWRPIGP
jgi:eukaryotic-like serine/threonine-protein kinase